MITISNSGWSIRLTKINFVKNCNAGMNDVITSNAAHSTDAATDASAQVWRMISLSFMQLHEYI